MQTFSFNPPINLLEEGKWLLAVGFFERTQSIYNITNKKNSFSINIPGPWGSETAEKTIDELNILLELRSLELHVKKIRKRGNQLKIKDNECRLSDFCTQQNEKLEELENVKYNDNEDLVYRMQMIYDEIIDILDLKYNPTTRTGYSLYPGIYEVVELNNTLKHILPNNVKVGVTEDDVRIKWNLKINQTLLFTQKSFSNIFRF